jgi:hypothetical protein
MTKPSCASVAALVKSLPERGRVAILGAQVNNGSAACSCKPELGEHDPASDPIRGCAIFTVANSHVPRHILGSDKRRAYYIGILAYKYRKHCFWCQVVIAPVKGKLAW